MLGRKLDKIRLAQMLADSANVCGDQIAGKVSAVCYTVRTCAFGSVEAKLDALAFGGPF